MNSGSADGAAIEAWTAAGLYDPAAANAVERAELLAWIADHGVTLEQMRSANDIDELGALVGDLALRPGRRLSAEEISEVTGFALDEIEKLRRATGFAAPDDGESPYRESDLELFATFRAASAIFTQQELTYLSLVIGNSMRRIAEAAVEMFMRDVEAPIKDRGQAPSVELAKANLEANQLAKSAVGVFEPLFLMHLERATKDMRRARSLTDDHHTALLTVGFIDLTGFTTRSGAASPAELLDLVLQFETTAVDLVSDRGGRLVKLIGDEVMFTAIDSDVACSIAADLVVAAGRWAAGARAGIARGVVIPSGGDVYGDVVNAAARIVDAAVSGEVLVTADVVGDAAQHEFEPAGRRALKGFAEPVRLWSLLPAAT